jgi:hypothetical protein
MKRVFYFILFMLALAGPYSVSAQLQFYLHDSSVRVYAYGQPQPLAWCGGFNNPQFCMGDLNHDGLQDLIVFEPWKGVSTFINMGTAGHPDYRYFPEYEQNFPPVFDYLVMADYNCDGIADLFQRGYYGFSVYRGYYNSRNQLCFSFYQDLYYDNDAYAHGSVNAYCNPGDIPCIVDVDNDGDLDFIAYNITGGRIYLYKNMRVELGLPCDSIHIALKDQCWGKVYQGFYRTHTLADPCDNTNLHRHTSGDERVTHSGNTPCLFDWDMDGDYDYLDGSVSYNEMTFLRNGRIPYNPSGVDSMVLQDTMWQSTGKQLELPVFPAAFNLDIDQDGKKDLLISPNLYGTGSENYHCIWFYKNYSTAGVADWRFQSDSFLTDKSIDAGTASYPVLYDYNKDGKPDLFVGSDGYYQSSTGGLLSRISYYQNTSTPGSPSFTLQTTDFLSIGTAGFKGAALAFGDIDNDGVADMLIGHSDGTISYFKNTAASDAVTPNWTLTQIQVRDESGNMINVTGSAAPFIYDIDKDGKKDLVIGNVYGTIQYYQNTSVAPGVISLRLINKQLGKAKADPRQGYGTYSAPFIGKIDSTGVEYLLLGSNSGNIYRYTGFQGGDTTATYTMLDSQYSYIDTMYSSYEHPSAAFAIYGNLRSIVTVGDIAGDGTYGLITGNIKGGLEYYRRKVYTVFTDTSHTGVQQVMEQGVINIHPNPAKDILNVSLAGVQAQEAEISVFNLVGQQLFSLTVQTGHGSTAIPLQGFLPGVYLCVVRSGVSRYYSRFTVEK